MPEPERIRHAEAIEWLNSLSMDLKLLAYTLTPEHQRYHREITIERLAEWDITHKSAIQRCHGTPNWNWKQNTEHAETLKAIDDFLDSIKRGIAEGDPAKYFDVNIHTQIIPDLERCRDQLIFY
jgi:hypothetical protein